MFSVLYTPKEIEYLLHKKRVYVQPKKKELYKMSAVCEKGLPTEKAGLSLII